MEMSRIPTARPSSSVKLVPTPKPTLFHSAAPPSSTSVSRRTMTQKTMKASSLPGSRQPVGPPTTDDFFSDMGLSAKPTFSSNKPRKLGAVPLAKDSNDNWDDDDDLDDLLDD